jgi:hypothetical protein
MVLLALFGLVMLPVAQLVLLRLFGATVALC